MRPLFVLPLIFAFFCQLTYAQLAKVSTKENDYWEETRLNFNGLVYGTFNSVNCTLKPENLVGCLAALNKMMEMQFPQKRVLVKLATDGSGAFEEVELTELSQVEFHRAVEDYLIELKKELDASSGVLLLMPLKIKERVSNFAKEHVTIANDSMSAGLLYNEYLKVAEDPHSYIIPIRKMTDRFQSTQSAKGNGYFYRPTEKNDVSRVIVTEVIKGSAAETSGILAGDIILKANEAVKFNEVVKVIHTADPIEYTMLRAGKEVTISLTKASFTIHNVEHRVLAQNGQRYGYIKLRSFSPGNSCSDIETATRALMRQGVKGLILDLRGNGGGLVEQAKCILQLFLENGSIVWGERTVSSDTIYATIGHRGKQIVKDLHSVILVDGMSASASEATSIYLKDYRKAFIVGERTYGKGSMQTITMWRRNSNLYNANTAALYYGPKGISPQVRGVEPDFTVYPDLDQTEPSKYIREEDRYAFPLRDKEVNPEDYVDNERLDEISTIKDCMAKSDVIKQKYESEDELGKILFDNQLESAQEILRCANENVEIYRGTDLKTVEHYQIIKAKNNRMH